MRTAVLVADQQEAEAQVLIQHQVALALQILFLVQPLPMQQAVA
jgi:hypothetical protein